MAKTIQEMKDQLMRYREQDPVVREALRKQASREKVSVSEVIRKSVRAYLKRKRVI